MSESPDPGRLKRRAASGASSTLAGQGGRLVFQFIGIIVLARLLSPEDYGLVAMVAAVAGIANVLRDFGLTFASVQSKAMSDELRSNLFWFNALAGVVSAAIVAALSWPISVLYDEPRLVALTLALAPMFLIDGLAAQYRADITRRMRFRALAAAEVGAVAIALVVATSAAVAGLTYWSLVIQQVTTSLAGLVLLSLWGGWWPQRFHRGVSAKRELTFGLDIFAAQLVNYAARNADSVIIGARLGAAELGIYDRAFQLLMLPIQRLQSPATRVALPVLSRLQDSPAEFSRFIQRGQLTLIHPVMFVMSAGAAFGSVLVPLVLGDQWAASALPFQILSVAGMAQAANYAFYWSYLATGKTRESLKLMVMYRPVQIAMLFIGSFWSITGVAVAYSLSQLIGWQLQASWTRRVPLTPRRELYRAGLRAYALHLSAAAGPAVLLGVLGVSIATVALAVGLFVGVYALLVGAVRPIRRDVAGSITAARAVLRRGR